MNNPLPYAVHTGTILCVEDEDDIRLELVDELQHAGYRVLAAASGEEALAVLSDVTPELIICDILMPGFSGLELLERIRIKFPRLSSTPFIFLSALADRSHVLQGLRLGADDYLAKPVDMEVLIHRVTAMLQLVARNRISARSIAGADTPTLTASLTPREQQVLDEIVLGYKNAEIARRLKLSEHTIGDYVKIIYKKLAVSSRSQAIRQAARMGLLRID